MHGTQQIARLFPVQVLGFLKSTMTRKPDNPGWGNGRPALVRASSPTEFELEAQGLGLTEEGYVSSPQLRSWCEHNFVRCYVPEWLLKRWGVLVDPSAF